jgi:hypothetical protein
MVTKQQAEEIVKVAAPGGFLYWLSKYVRIEDGQAGAIPFELWPCHLEASQALLDHRRIVILKARQIGMSWLFGAAYPLWLAQFHPAKLAMLFSRGEDESTELVRKCRFIWTRQPEWMRVPLSKDNAMLLEFQGLDSRIMAFPCKPDAGSGFTAAYVLSDEHAKQQYAKQQEGAIRPTIDMGGQHVSLSSAYGPGTHHHNIWRGANAGTNGYHPIFFPYTCHPKRDQQWWDRMKPTYDEEWVFHQEYPRSAREAIQSSVPRIFPDTYLEIEAPNAVTSTDVLRTQADEDLSLLSRVQSRGEELGFRCYQLPRPDGHYVMGVDVAEGQINGDASSAVVLDRETGEEVAVLHGRWDVEDFAKYELALGEAYHALVGIERNNHGGAVIKAHLRLQVARPFKRRTSRLFYEKALFDAQGKISRAGKPGWYTSVRTKPLMITDLQTAVREKDVKVASQALLNEMEVFQQKEDGSMGAPKGYHDDLVMALAIAYQMCKEPVARARPQVEYAMGQTPAGAAAKAGARTFLGRRAKRAVHPRPTLLQRISQKQTESAAW